MGLVQRRRPKVGDVIEIETPKGLAYAQYTYKHDRPPRYGALLRVLPGLFQRRPTDFSELVNQPEQFVVFFPLGAAVWRGIVTIVANEEIPGWARRLPFFRVRGGIDQSGRVLNWGLWDGERDYRIEGELTPEQRNLPILEVITDVILINRIVEGWSPADDV